MTPCGTYTPPNRSCGFAAVFAVAVNAGTIASSRGRATVAPMPCKNVRRPSDIFVMNITGSLKLPASSFSTCSKLAVGSYSDFTRNRNCGLFTMPMMSDENR